MPSEGDDDEPTMIEVEFYVNAAGAEPVLDWLNKMSKKDRHAIGRDLMRVQYRWPVAIMPLAKHLEKGLWEVRISLPSSKIARLIFFAGDDMLVVVHGFIKKTQKTPRQHIDIALKRKKDYEDAY
jgi:phage-related protein